MAPDSEGLKPNDAGPSGAADGRSRRVPEPYLKDELLDRLARTNLELLSELWITRDRLAVMERLLVDKGVLAPEEIDRFHPDEAFSRYVEVLRTQMVENVVGAPLKNDHTVADLTARAQRARQAKIR
jgi:hypothetical protein